MRSSSQSSRSPMASSRAPGWPGPSGIPSVSAGSKRAAASAAVSVSATARTLSRRRAPDNLRAMSEEWRVEVELDEERHGFSLGERLRSHSIDDEARERLGGRAIVTRDGSRIFVYTGNEEAAREAERVLRELLAADELSANVWISRWHPDAETWKDASEPMPDSDSDRIAEYRGREAAALEKAERTGEMPFEVRLDLPKLSDALTLVDELREQGLPGRAPLAPRHGRRPDRGARRRDRRGAAPAPARGHGGRDRGLRRPLPVLLAPRLVQLDDRQIAPRQRGGSGRPGASPRSAAPGPRPSAASP